MPITDEQIDLIFKYLDNELNDDDEAAFINQLENNPELQQFFDQHILISTYLQKEEYNVNVQTIESADEYLANIKQALERKKTETNVIPIAKKRINVLVAAAAVIGIIIIGYATYFFIKTQKQDNPIVKNIEKKDVQTPIIPKTTIDSSKLLADNNNVMQEIYERYKTDAPSALDDVPSSATIYKFKYEHNVKEMANEKEDALNTKGEENTADKKEILNYFNFYKAISNIKLGKTKIADDLLNDILKNTQKNSSLNNQAKWYLLIVYLKDKNKTNALPLAESIKESKKSPYNKQAAEILSKLK